MQEKMKMQEEIEEMQKQMSQQQKDQDLLQQRYDNLKDELEIARRDVIQRSSSDVCSTSLIRIQEIYLCSLG